MAGIAQLEVISEHRCFGGVQGFYRRASLACALPMRFSVYQPPQARTQRVPVLFFLAGLTCSEETFMVKAGAQRLASELGLMLVTCDTSPRDTGVDGATGDWEFGEGAGFYVDATQAPFAGNFRMYSHVSGELPGWIAADFPADSTRMGICGHSMGGHGALVIGLRNPAQFRSVSALAPIVTPSHVPWGENAFARLLGGDRTNWRDYDASELVGHAAVAGSILIDQGDADKFLDVQLRPAEFAAACARSGQALELRRHAGYDHGYWFVQTVIGDHLHHHARALA